MSGAWLWYLDGREMCSRYSETCSGEYADAMLHTQVKFHLSVKCLSSKTYLLCPST